MSVMSATDNRVETAPSVRHWIVWTTVLSGLVIVLHASVLKALVSQWWTDPDYGHGFLVPLFSGFVLWRRRNQLARSEIQPSNWGALLMLAAVVLLLAGSLGAELFTSRFSLIVLLAGMILFLAGWKVLRLLSFPVSFLILMIPFPVIIYNQLTFPLQLIASRFATYWLELAQVPVLREGNVLILPNYSLEVVEACSGIRSLMTLVTLTVAYCYLSEPRRWARYLLVTLTVPIAIISNAIRVTGTGLLTYHLGPRAAEGFFHEFSGWIVFVAALLLMFACHWILRRVGTARLQASHA